MSMVADVILVLLKSEGRVLVEMKRAPEPKDVNEEPGKLLEEACIIIVDEEKL